MANNFVLAQIKTQLLPPDKLFYSRKSWTEKDPPPLGLSLLSLLSESGSAAGNWASLEGSFTDHHAALQQQGPSRKELGDARFLRTWPRDPEDKSVNKFSEAAAG